MNDSRSGQLFLPGCAPAPESPALLPTRESPVYRLLHTPAACSLLEVLAVLVGEEAALALLARYGSASAIANAPTLEVAQTRHVGPARLARLKAAAEFGQRTLSDRPERPLINSPADAVSVLRPRLQGKEQEFLFVLLLDARGRLMGEPVEVYHGSLNTALVRTSEVFRDAVRVNAAAIIVAHNHPSGDPSPSPEDLAVTRQMVEAGRLLDIPLLDHCVIGGQRFVSLKDRTTGLFTGKEDR